MSNNVEQRRAPTVSGSTPATWMLVGLALAAGLGIVAGIAFEIGPTYGRPALWIACVVAGVVFNIGAIGKAVEIGVRAARR